MVKKIRKEVVWSFVKMVENHLNSYQADNRLKVVRDETCCYARWYKSFAVPCSDYSIEIQQMQDGKKQTLLGVMIFKLNISYTNFCETKREAEECDIFNTKVEIHQHTFFYKHGSWLMKSREHSISDIPTGIFVTCTSKSHCVERRPQNT